MQWGWALFYLAVTIAAARASRNGPERWYGLALVANVIAFNVICALTPAAAGPGLNLLCEFLLFEVAMVSAIVYHDHLHVFFTLAFISVLSLAVTTCVALGDWPFGGYEYVVNGLLLAECSVVGRRGIANVIGRILNVVRGRGGLRHALDHSAVRRHGMVAVPFLGSERSDDRSE